MLLIFDVWFLLKAVFTTHFVPIVPVLAGMLTAGGLLFIVYAEQKAREADKRDHRRISRVAHQLESPLRALQEDFTGLLRNADSLPAEQRLTIKRMETKTKILLENIRDVFLMLQAQEQTVARELRMYNLCTLVEQAVERQKVLAAAHNVELVYVARCQDAPVRVERQLLQIVLAHLLENAILYSFRPGLVNVAVTANAKEARVVVQDRGIGLASGEQVLVWQPFARGERAEQFDPDGIGVGLTLSRLLMREMGGDLIGGSRDKSAGAQFEIILPLARK